MRICRVDIERFLGFKNLSMELDSTLQLIAGPNNAGKSSLVRLLESFFSDPQDGQLLGMHPLNSYYSALGPRTLSSITLWFQDLSDEEAEVFAPIVRTNDGRFWVQIRSTRKGAISYLASRKPSAEEAERLYHELIDRFHFVKIPSVRVGGPNDSGESESLERLLDTLESILVRRGSTRSTSLQQEFAKAMDPVETMVLDVLDRSAEAIIADLPFQESEVRFRLPETRMALRAMLESAVIESHGAVDVPVSERGTGFQSALVLGILRYVAGREAGNGANVMFAIEEPEAFLHPQTQRAMGKIISEISSDAQVLVTTHSAVLVDSFNIRQIARLPLDPDGLETTWRRPQLTPSDAGRLTRYCSAANSELVFAQAVVFVEGEGDLRLVEALLSRACNYAGGHYALGIAVIETTGLPTMRYLVQLAELLGVQSYVLSDRDGLHKNGDGRRVLLDVLGERSTPMSPTVANKLRLESDKVSSSLTAAIKRQQALNDLLGKYGAFVQSSDLEGLMLDSFGHEHVLDVVGPSGERLLDKATVDAMLASDDPRETVASWLNTKGWNSDRSTKGKKKMQSYLGPVFLDAWYKSNAATPRALRPLDQWLRAIIKNAHPAPV